MTILSRGARLCESIIRAARARKGGARVCGRNYLARRLACSRRTVSRYTAELVAAGRLDVTPPRRVRGPKGWRTVGCNAYRLTRPHNLAPHVQKPLSRRGDTHGTPPPRGGRVQGRKAPAPPDPSERISAREGMRRLLAQLETQCPTIAS